ncbi:hypothetical protein C7B80_25115 [Cyanosarcina cf. burmensis CCALA 770]|nr:hypothetical protein C7B80_25115 [Cyanosarcina cf. burmensis CCALA 770]
MQYQRFFTPIEIRKFSFILAFTFLGIGFWALSSLFLPDPAATQVPTVGGADIIDTAIANAQLTSETYDRMWIDTLTGPAYRSLSVAAAGFSAFGAIVWFAFKYELVSQAWNDVKPFFYRFFISPLLVSIFLSVPINDTTLLGETTLALRNFGNRFSQITLQATSNSINDPLASSLTRTQVETLAGKGFQRCLEEPAQEERYMCLDELERKALKLLSSYIGEEWAQKLRDRIQDDINNAKTPDKIEAFFSSIGDRFSNSLSNAGVAFVLVAGNAIIFGTTSAIEVIGIEVAKLGPLMLALSLFPAFEKFAVLWLTLLGGLGAVSFLLKDAIVQASMMIIQSEGPTDLIGPAVLAVVSLFIVIGLATGSGVAAFQGAISGATAAGSALGRMSPTNFR